MPVVQTNEPGMQSAAQEFSNKTNEFTGHLRSVNTEMATLQSSWTGDASSKFNAAMDAWEGAFQRVINELITMMQTMGVNTQYYSQAEDSASNSAASFGAALPPLPGM